MKNHLQTMKKLTFYPKWHMHRDNYKTIIEVNNMCKTIAIISWKGGVGKTTSAVNISSYIQQQGKRVCAVDLDPQHSMSNHFGVYPGHLRNKPTAYDLLNAAIDDTDSEEMSELVHASICKTTTVDLIPATPKLSALDIKRLSSLLSTTAVILPKLSNAGCRR